MKKAEKKQRKEMAKEKERASKIESNMKRYPHLVGMFENSHDIQSVKNLKETQKTLSKG